MRGHMNDAIDSNDRTTLQISAVKDRSIGGNEACVVYNGAGYGCFWANQYVIANHAIEFVIGPDNCILHDDNLATDVDGTAMAYDNNSRADERFFADGNVAFDDGTWMDFGGRMYGDGLHIEVDRCWKMTMSVRRK